MCFGFRLGGGNSHNPFRTLAAKDHPAVWHSGKLLVAERLQSLGIEFDNCGMVNCVDFEKDVSNRHGVINLL